jgi:hypothetical protein
MLGGVTGREHDGGGTNNSKAHANMSALKSDRVEN